VVLSLRWAERVSITLRPMLPVAPIIRNEGAMVIPAGLLVIKIGP
jgi:hypothetical protein